MSTTNYDKLKEELVNISSILEKFPDDLKPKVFDILVNTFNGNTTSQNPSPAANPDEVSKKSQPKPSKEESVGNEIVNGNSKKSSGAKKTSTESYSIDRNLNLRGNQEIPSFKSFFEEKQPLSTAEINAVSVYYLKNLLNLEKVSLDHVYTCYKEAGKKPADHFKQSFRDTKNKQGYIEFDDDWNLTIPHRGVSFVEYDLPHQKKKAK